MKILKIVIGLMCIALLSGSCSKRQKRILVFSKTEGFRHSCIPAGIAAIQKLANAESIEIDTTEDATLFNEENLKKYSAVVFLNTTGDVFNPIQQANFERYIQAGGGFVGIHSATDTEYEWPWYNKLVGAYFDGHPAVQEAEMHVLNTTHPSTLNFHETWTKTDEWYNFKSIYDGIDVLIEIDEESYEGGKHKEKQHPISWYHEYDGGRSFYTAMGHTDETFSDSLFLKHLKGGIAYAIGKNTLDYSLSYSHRVSDESRFAH